jgi:ABC-type phosphate transport system substrate-binding protein
MRVRTRRIAAAAAVGIVSLTGGLVGVSPADASTPFTPNKSSDWIRMGGSDTTEGMMNRLALLFNESPGCVLTGTPQNLDGRCFDFDAGTAGIQEQYQNDAAGNPTDAANTDHDVAFNYFAVGSGTGINQLAQRGNAGVQVIDVARSSRAPRATDADGIRFFAYAKDAIPWVKFPGSPASAVSSLSSAQLKNIFSGCAPAAQPEIDKTANGGNNNGFADWGDVGGVTGQPIVVWAAQDGSGTRTTFDGFLGSGASSTNCIPTQYKDNSLANGERRVFENNAEPIKDSTSVDCNAEFAAASLTTPASCAANSIFYYSIGRWNTSGGETSILGNITVAGNPVAPTEANILSDAFPYSRYVYNAIRNDTFSSGLAANAVRNFVSSNGFICKSAANSATNPKTGNNFRTDVENVIRGEGFIPLPLGSTGAGGGQSHCRATDTASL